MSPNFDGIMCYLCIAYKQKVFEDKEKNTL